MMRATIFVVALKISVAIGSTSSDMSQQLSRREALETDMIDTTMIAGKGRMTSAETQRLDELETTIKTGWLSVARALREIRDSGLYRDDYRTFEQYVLERWGYDSTYAHRLVSAATIAERMLPIGNIPSSESICRELARIDDPAIQQTVWTAVHVAAEENGKIPTAATVRRAVDEHFERVAPAKPERDREPGEDDETLEEALAADSERKGLAPPAAKQKPAKLIPVPKKSTKAHAEQAVANASYHRGLIAHLNALVRDLLAVPNGPGTDLLLSRFSTIEREIQKLKGDIASTMPKAVCPRCHGPGCCHCSNQGWVSSSTLHELNKTAAA